MTRERGYPTRGSERARERWIASVQLCVRAIPTTYGGGAHGCGIVDRGVDVRLGGARACDARDGVLRGRGVRPGAVVVVGEVESVRVGLSGRVALLRARCGAGWVR